MLSERERVVLNFLSMGRMEATAAMVGEDLALHGLCRGGFQAVGAAVLGAMRKKGLVYFLKDLQAWRIAKAGREAIANYHNLGVDFRALSATK